jgi:hypothetical protein
MEGSGGIVASNVRRNACQVVSKLMAPTVDCARNRARDSSSVKRKVSERDSIVVSAMVEEKLRDGRELFGDIARQLEIVEVPTILIPRRGSKQEYASNWLVDLLLCQIPQQNGSAHRMRNQDHSPGDTRQL